MNDLLNLVAQVHPQLVIKAPNGDRLYIDVTPGPNGQNSTSLWPNGFTVGLDAGQVPTDANVTTNPSAFFLRQSPTLLSAPGFGGVSWGAWLFLAVAIALLPLVGVYLWKK